MSSIKTILLWTLLFCFTSPVFSAEILNNKGSPFNYCYHCLQKEEKRFVSGRKSFYDQLKLVRNIHHILLDFLNTAEDAEFYEQLRKLKPSIELLSNTSQDLFFQIFPDKFCDRRPVKVDGSIIHAYYNIFSQTRRRSDSERKAGYAEEVARHKGIKLLPKRLLTNKVKQTLIPAQSYNFIVNLGNEAYISYEQRYRLKEEREKILISPNHTLLAGNNPVLAAGVFTYYRVDQKELYFITSSSGHFHPKPDSLKYMKNYLIKLGIPEEAIILFSLKYNQIVEELSKFK